VGRIKERKLPRGTPKAPNDSILQPGVWCLKKQKSSVPIYTISPMVGVEDRCSLGGNPNGPESSIVGKRDDLFVAIIY